MDTSPHGTGSADGNGLSAAQEARLIQNAKAISVISIVVCALFGAVSIVIGFRDQSIALMGLAFEFLLDAITSVFVLWRFKEPKDPTLSVQNAQLSTVRRSEPEEQRRLRKLRRDLQREKNSNIAVGICFLISAGILMCSASYKIFTWRHSEHEQQDKETATFSEIIAWPCFFLFGGFGIFKMQLSRELKSEVLKKDAICSVL